MITREILKTHPVSNLKAELRKSNIKNIGSMKKAEVIEEIMKRKSDFNHIKPHVKAKPAKPSNPPELYYDKKMGEMRKTSVPMRPTRPSKPKGMTTLEWINKEKKRIRESKPKGMTTVEWINKEKKRIRESKPKGDNKKIANDYLNSLVKKRKAVKNTNEDDEDAKIWGFGNMLSSKDIDMKSKPTKLDGINRAKKRARQKKEANDYLNSLVKKGREKKSQSVRDKYAKLEGGGKPAKKTPPPKPSNPPELYYDKELGEMRRTSVPMRPKRKIRINKGTHKMPDGSIMTGKTHNSKSKLLPIREEPAPRRRGKVSKASSLSSIKEEDFGKVKKRVRKTAVVEALPPQAPPPQPEPVRPKVNNVSKNKSPSELRATKQPKIGTIIKSGLGQAKEDALNLVETLVPKRLRKRYNKKDKKKQLTLEEVMRKKK
tara:strand:- start:304 stop:1593 length:1290 start_codon:yes stop_codon:yes gene_type:complete